MGQEKTKTPAIYLDTKQYFTDTVREALSERKVIARPTTELYLIQLLEQFTVVDALYEEDKSGARQKDTLAELFLKAANSAGGVRIELLKKLGDSALYISGFFGDSLSRKVVDVDYYADMGGTAYHSLSSVVREESFKETYSELGKRFLEFVDVLTHISGKTNIQGSGGLLRLYERYVLGGSSVARDKIFEKGFIAPSYDDNGKKVKQ